MHTWTSICAEMTLLQQYKYITLIILCILLMAYIQTTGHITIALHTSINIIFICTCAIHIYMHTSYIVNHQISYKTRLISITYGTVKMKVAIAAYKTPCFYA